MIKKMKTYKIEERLFVYMLIFGIMLSVINIINNTLIGFPEEANAKWGLLSLTAGIGLIFTRKFENLNGKFMKAIKFVVFSEIIFIFLPNGWLYSGGINPSTQAYVFLICIAVCFVCEGAPRLFFLISEIAVVILLMCLEAFHPEILRNSASTVFFWDSLIQVPTAIIASSILLVMFSNAFRREQKTLSEYSQMLKIKNEALVEMTIKDELTGLYNRRYIFEHLGEMWQDFDRYQNIRLALVDVDNFKQVNDTYGHVIGDNILKRISRVMSEQMIEQGFAGRYGGDEFVLVFVDMTLNDVLKKLDQIRADVLMVKIEGKSVVSLSGGLTRLTAESNVDEALSRADDLLYQCKRQSKNAILSDEGFRY